MIIVEIVGGLGNQLFGFALCEKFRSLGCEVKTDRKYYEREADINRAYPLGDYEVYYHFGEDYPEATQEEIERYSETKFDFFSKVRRKLFGLKKTYVWENTISEFHPDVLKIKEAYLSGHWQTGKYFSDIRERILEKFTFPPFSDEKNRSAAEAIMQTNSVSLHIRFYELESGHDNYPSKAVVNDAACSKLYYRKAVELIKEKVPNPEFYVFSQFIPQAREILGDGEEFHYVDWNTRLEDNIQDLHLMTLCKHNIIANSTFSWWGAWLNQNPEKIVIAPDPWFIDLAMPDIWCDGWVRISGETGEVVKNAE